MAVKGKSVLRGSSVVCDTVSESTRELFELLRMCGKEISKMSLEPQRVTPTTEDDKLSEFRKIIKEVRTRFADSGCPNRLIQLLSSRLDALITYNLEQWINDTALEQLSCFRLEKVRLANDGWSRDDIYAKQIEDLYVRIEKAQTEMMEGLLLVMGVEEASALWDAMEVSLRLTAPQDRELVLDEPSNELTLFDCRREDTPLLNCKAEVWLKQAEVNGKQWTKRRRQPKVPVPKLVVTYEIPGNFPRILVTCEQ